MITNTSLQSQAELLHSLKKLEADDTETSHIQVTHGGTS